MPPEKPPPLRFALIGPGQIAQVFAESLLETGAGSVACVFGRNLQKARTLAERFGGEAVADLEAAIGHSAVQAVYVATPHSAHAEAVQAALEAGLPVLCEKPLSPRLETTRALFALAAQSSVPLLEGYMYRAHPQIDRALAIVQSGELGALRRIESHFGFHAPYDRQQRLFAPELAGGAILDVGGYPLSLTLALARAAGIPSEQSLHPDLTEVDGELAASGVDAHGEAELHFPAGLSARVRVSLRQELGRGALVHGTLGSLRLEDPFLPSGQRRGRQARLWVETERQRREERIEARADCFALEAEELSRMVHARQLEPRAPFVGRAESLALAALLERWRERLGAL
jgi:predicted dehydrogenase